MKKVLLAVITVLGLTYGASAQTQGSRISIGADLAVPTGDLAVISSLGYGGSLQGEFAVAKSLSLTASAGYLTFGFKKVFKDAFEEAGISVGNQSAIPLKGGAKYYFLKNVYGAAELGAALSTGEEGGTAFLYAPTVGISFPLAGKNAVDLGLRYESWSNEGTSSFIGLRASFAFGL